jgi:hypothetical protein
VLLDGSWGSAAGKIASDAEVSQDGGICNMFGRGATIVSHFIVVALFKAYGVAGVTAFMTGLPLLQILAIAAWGIEPARRSLEELDAPKVAL